MLHLPTTEGQSPLKCGDLVLLIGFRRLGAWVVEAYGAVFTCYSNSLGCLGLRAGCPGIKLVGLPELGNQGLI